MNKFELNVEGRTVEERGYGKGEMGKVGEIYSVIACQRSFTVFDYVNFKVWPLYYYLIRVWKFYYLITCIFIWMYFISNVDENEFLLVAKARLKS